jgi:hypothetical protein
MVGPGSTCCNQLVANAPWEGEIGDPVAVEVT